MRKVDHLYFRSLLFIQGYSVLFGNSLSYGWKPKVEIIIWTWEIVFILITSCVVVSGVCKLVPILPIYQVNLAFFLFINVTLLKRNSPCFCQCISLWLWISAFVGGVAQPQCVDGCDSWVLRWVVLSWDLMAGVIRPVSSPLALIGVTMLHLVCESSQGKDRNHSRGGRLLLWVWVKGGGDKLHFSNSLSFKHPNSNWLHQSCTITKKKLYL